MRKALCILFLFVLCLPAVLADVYITEIMYNPDPFSDTDAEWVEIFNSGSSPVDLTDWKLSGSNFDDIVLPSNQYLVIARELLDGSDEDLESFEFVYGDGNNIWDESFLAVDGTMSLTDDDSVILESPSGVEDVVNYTSAIGGQGNGHSIYLNVDSWEEHPLVGGSPGRGEDSTLLVSFTIEDLVLAIGNISFEDDLPVAGFQIIPSPGVTREIVFAGIFEGSDVSGSVSFLGNTSSLVVEGSNISGSIFIPSDLAPGNYSITLSLTQSSQTVEEIINFEVMELVALELSSTNLDFGSVSKGIASPYQSVALSNIGNVLIDADVFASDFSSNSSTLSSSIISLDDVPLSSSQSFNLDLVPSAIRVLNFSASIPVNATAGDYVGAISIVGRP